LGKKPIHQESSKLQEVEKLLSESIENKTNNNHLNQHQLEKKSIHQIFVDKKTGREEREEDTRGANSNKNRTTAAILPHDNKQ